MVSAVIAESEGELPVQPSLRRIREFNVRPKHDLGQNFLIDSNILGVIDRLAELGPDDVVLEIGGGLGVLSEHLAPLCSHLHVIELDQALVPALEDALANNPNTTKVVANLPYGIAATVILRSVELLPQVTRWVAMVQREVGERFAASPGEKAYGAPSVIAQLSCEVRVARAISRNVFHPVPNVDSVLITLDRTGPPPPDQLRKLVRAAFAHRRKALPRSLATAGYGGNEIRDRARAALERLELPLDVRAERLSPDQFRALLEELAR